MRKTRKKAQRKIKAYLAHCHKMRDEGKLLQFFLETMFPKLEIINPFEHGDKTARWLSGEKTQQLADEIVDKDFYLIKSSDFVIAFIPPTAHILIGTPMEVFYARMWRNKTTVVLTPNEHPWLKKLRVIWVKDLQELQEAVKFLVRNPQ